MASKLSPKTLEMDVDQSFKEAFGSQISFHAFSIGGGLREDGMDTGWRRLPASLLEMPSGGTWELWTEGCVRAWEIGSGEALFVPAWVRHRLRCRAEKSMTTSFILGSFRWLENPDLLSSAAIPPAISGSAGSKLLPCVEEMAKLWEGGCEKILELARLHELSFRVLGLLLEEAKNKDIRANEALGRLSKALEAMRAKPEAKLSCRELASLAGLSPSRFNAVFRDVVGIAPKPYLQSLRLRKASMLLLSSDEPVYAIAEECGFASSCYFCRFFARQTGMTPAAFRKEFGNAAGLQGVLA